MNEEDILFLVKDLSLEETKELIQKANMVRDFLTRKEEINVDVREENSDLDNEDDFMDWMKAVEQQILEQQILKQQQIKQLESQKKTIPTPHIINPYHVDLPTYIPGKSYWTLCCHLSGVDI